MTPIFFRLQVSKLWYRLDERFEIGQDEYLCEIQTIIR